MSVGRIINDLRNAGYTFFKGKYTVEPNFDLHFNT